MANISFGRVNRISAASLSATCTAFFMLILAASASAETLMMPNRDARMGTAMVVWGVTDIPNNVAANTTTYDIDFGDGSAHATGNVVDRSYITAIHTYGSAGTKTATLKITHQTPATVETATAVIKVFDTTTITADENRSLGINMAIQDGLRWLWTAQTSRAANFPAAVTTNWSSSTPYTSLVVLAFENQGFRLTNDDVAATGIYEKYIVRRGLN